MLGLCLSKTLGEEDGAGELGAEEVVEEVVVVEGRNQIPSESSKDSIYGRCFVTIFRKLTFT